MAEGPKRPLIKCFGGLEGVVPLPSIDNFIYLLKNYNV